MVATISADIVRSTSLKTEDLIEMRKKLLGLFNDLSERSPGFWGRIVRGDTLECLLPNYCYALRISILIKLCVKKMAGQYECSDWTKRHGVRFSIGIGGIKYESRSEDIIDGPAIYLSGRNLNGMSGKNDVYSAIEVEGATIEMNHLLFCYVAMISSIVDSYSKKQAEVIYYKLLGLKEREISELLGISQSAVNIRAAGAQWGVIYSALLSFENLNFEKLCG